MTSASLTILVLLGLATAQGLGPDGEHPAAPASFGPEPGVEALVARLGSARYADRQAADAALERLGAEALPALREALQSRDAEVRTRAATLIEKIGSDQMTRPTMVTLDFDDQPLDEVVKAINARSGLNLALEPQNAALWKAKRVTLHEPRPVPFWTAVDALCQAGGVQIAPGVAMPMGGRTPPVRLTSGSGDASPTSDQGPFRVTLNSIHLHRDLALGRPAAPGVAFVQPGGFAPMPAPGGQVVELHGPRVGAVQKVAAAPDAAGPPRPSHEQFYAQLQVMTEPRLMLVHAQELKLLEAVDERGQSLLLTAPEGNPGQTVRMSGYAGVASGASIQLPVHLRRPPQAGRTIKTLRGVLPVTVSARRPDPLVVPLGAESVGKSFRNGDVTITLQTSASDPRQGTAAEIVIRPTGSTADAAALMARGEPPAGAFVSPGMVQNQVELVDDRGRLVPSFPQATNFQPDEIRLTVRAVPAPGAAAPVQLRFYGLTQATSEVAFEFKDIPMP